MALNIRTSLAMLAIIISAAAAGCAREEPDEQVPVPQATTETATPLNRPTSVTGCLRAGDAANTYVLTTSLDRDGMNPATYNLTGASRIDLREYVGQQVVVDGTLTQQQELATRDVQPSTPDRPQGTTGTPAVETGTKLAVRELEVSGIRSIAGECEDQ